MPYTQSRSGTVLKHQWVESFKRSIMHDARSLAVTAQNVKTCRLRDQCRFNFVFFPRFVLKSDALWPFRYDINSIHNPMRLENVVDAFTLRFVFLLVLLRTILISIVSWLCLPSLRLNNLLQQFVLIIIIVDSTQKKNVLSSSVVRCFVGLFANVIADAKHTHGEKKTTSKVTTR